MFQFLWVAHSRTVYPRPHAVFSAFRRGARLPSKVGKLVPRTGCELCIPLAPSPRPSLSWVTHPSCVPKPRAGPAPPAQYHVKEAVCSPGTVVLEWRVNKFKTQCPLGVNGGQPYIPPGLRYLVLDSEEVRPTIGLLLAV